MDEKLNNFAKWVEAGADRADPTELTLWPWNRPDYARKVIVERVEPYATKYEQLDDVIGDTLGRDENGDWSLPNENYWKPTAPMRAMLRELAMLERKMTREVPNPRYDPVKAAAWEQDHALRFDQTTIEVGQSYWLPEPEDAG